MRTFSLRDGQTTAPTQGCTTNPHRRASAASRKLRSAALAGTAFLCSWLCACRNEPAKHQAQESEVREELPVGRGPDEVLHPGCSTFGSTNGSCQSVCEKDGRCWMTQYREPVLDIGPTCGCGPVSDDDCKRARGCKARGLCHAGEGECIPGGDEHCQQSTACQERGLCGLHYDWNEERASCGASSDAGCKASHACVTAGECAWLGNRCVAPQVCTQALDCKDEGLCGIWLGQCAATESAHCADSNACREFGRCVARDGKCVATTDAMCRDAGACRREGRCTPEYGECVARSDAQCRGSIVCKHGECWAFEGRCSLQGTPPTDASACSQNFNCREHGRCDLRKLPGVSTPQCLPSTTEHCAASLDCKRYGRCALATSAALHCEPATDEDCRSSVDCKRTGACSRVVATGDTTHPAEAVCKPTTDEECRRSEGCPHSGNCSLRGGVCVNWYRVLETDDEDTDYFDNY